MNEMVVSLGSGDSPSVDSPLTFPDLVGGHWYLVSILRPGDLWVWTQKGLNPLSHFDTTIPGPSGVGKRERGVSWFSSSPSHSDSSPRRRGTSSLISSCSNRSSRGSGVTHDHSHTLWSFPSHHGKLPM